MPFASLCTLFYSGAKSVKSGQVSVRFVVLQVLLLYELGAFLLQKAQNKKSEDRCLGKN